MATWDAHLLDGGLELLPGELLGDGDGAVGDHVAVGADNLPGHVLGRGLRLGRQLVHRRLQLLPAWETSAQKLNNQLGLSRNCWCAAASRLMNMRWNATA